MDFGVFLYEEGGRRARYYAFLMVLSYSRMTYVEFVEHQDLNTFIRCHIHAFEALGIPEILLYDNLKAVVLGRDETGKPQLNSRFVDFAVALGFRPRICQPYRPQTKGRVERTVGYLRQNFWPGRTFASLADLNQQVRVWCAETQLKQDLEMLGLKDAALALDAVLDAAARSKQTYAETLGELLTAELRVMSVISKPACAWPTCPSTSPWRTSTSATSLQWTKGSSVNWRL